MSEGRCTFCDASNPPGRRNCISCGAELPGALDLPPAPSEASAFEEEVLRLAREQGIIPAIKHYREVTGAGLAEAKSAVEALVAGGAVPPRGGEANEAELLTIARERGKIAAIKRHRELTGSGLKEAKDAVEGLLARTGAQPAVSRAGCGAYVLAMAILAAALAFVGI